MDSRNIYKAMLKKCPNTKRNKHYLKRYVRFIKNCSIQNSDLPNDVYTEKHHILPRSIWPEYEKFSSHSWNKSVLTARQHIIAHYMLYKAFGGTMTGAFFSMLKGFSMHKYIIRLPSREYEQCKNEYSILRSAQLKEQWGNGSRDNVGKNVKLAWTEEARENFSGVMKERWKDNNKRKEKHSEDMKRYWSDKENRITRSKLMTGQNNPMFGLFGESAPNYGRRNSKETIELMSELKVGNKNPFYGKKHKKKKCPHCNKEIAANNYARYHGSKCKELKKD